MLEITKIKEQLGREWELHESEREALISILGIDNFHPNQHFFDVLKKTTLACAEAQMLYEMAVDAEGDVDPNHHDYQYWGCGEQS